MVPDASNLLTALARSVRGRRREFGWSRSELARRSGISERFLARVESGDGNISVMKLAGLAEALPGAFSPHGNRWENVGFAGLQASAAIQ